jgi:hypothetical protein
MRRDADAGVNVLLHTDEYDLQIGNAYFKASKTASNLPVPRHNLQFRTGVRDHP